jgi:hypothetical protein
MDMSSSLTSTSNGGAGFRFNDGASLYDTNIVNQGFHIVAWQMDDGDTYSDATMFVDGTLPANVFTGSSTNATGTTTFGSDLELILGTGRSAGGSLFTNDYYTGELAEYLVFNSQLSVGQINLVANYLSTEYGLPFAYETNLLFSEAALKGDFNHDGLVDATDYTIWRKTGVYGEQGYLDWRANYGATVAGFESGAAMMSGTGSVPEPVATVFVAIAGFGLGLVRRRSRHRFGRKCD